MSTPTAFISGHTDLTREEFDAHYLAPLRHVLREGHRVVVGNAEGGDTMALQHLLANGHDSALITVYVFRGRQMLYPVATVGNWTSYSQRDAAMTAASDYDLCWVRPEAECRRLYGDKYRKRVSGTEQNVLRRQEMARDDFYTDPSRWNQSMFLTPGPQRGV